MGGSQEVQNTKKINIKGAKMFFSSKTERIEKT